MANGDLARALAYQSNLQSDTRALFRQWMDSVTQSNERDKQRLYESTIRDEERKISESIREEDRQRYINEQNRNEERYQFSVRMSDRKNNTDEDFIKINQGSEILNLKGQKDYYKKLIDSVGIKTEAGISAVESKINFLDVKIADAVKNTETLNDIGMPEYYVNQASNFYMQGNDAAAFNIVDNHFKTKFKDPQTLAEAQLLITDLKRDNTSLGKLAGAVGEGVDDERKRLQKSIDNSTRRFRELYELKTPFDPEALQRSFSTNAQTRLKNAGFDLSDKEVLQRLLGETGNYSEAIQAWEDKYILGEDASTQSAKEASADAVKIINNIIAKEKGRPPTIEPEFDYSNINKLDIEGTALLGYGGYKLAKGGLRLAKEPTMKAYNYLNNKAVQASKHIKFVTGMPSKDVISFMESANSNRVGSIGRSMPSIEKAKNIVESLSDKPKSKEYKDAVKSLNDRIKSVSTSLKKRGIVTNIKDSDLEKLLKNPNKWRLAKLKARFAKVYPGLKSGALKWGVLSASAKIGEALGDPTGGVATAVGTASAVKGIKSIYKKKGSKWLMSKLAPVVKKSVAKRIVGGLAAGAAGGPTAIAGAIAGTGLAIYDIYQFLESLSEGGSEEEATAVLQNSIQRDPTQAQIDSAQVADSTNWFLPAIK